MLSSNKIKDSKNINNVLIIILNKKNSNKILRIIYLWKKRYMMIQFVINKIKLLNHFKIKLFFFKLNISNFLLVNSFE
jgi:hypothetical protein